VISSADLGEWTPLIGRSKLAVKTDGVPRQRPEGQDKNNDPEGNQSYLYGSIALFVGEEVGGRSRSVEKSKSGTFPPRLEIPQEGRDFHFSHRPHDDYN
jgi:hypothetical protein